MKVVMTIDVEDWYQTNGFDFSHNDWNKFEERVHFNTRKMLTLLDAYHVKATFFILGYVAERYPELVKEIHMKGHEIGCHSHYHRLVNQVSQAEQLEDIAHAKRILEDIIGEPVVFFRAPSWSLGKNELWLLNELEKMGFKCDSSIQPFKTPLSGFARAPLKPFRPQVGSHTLTLVEFPTTIFQLGLLRFPYSGGFYFRVLPYQIIKMFLKVQARSMPVMVYFHPWEIEDSIPKVKYCYLKKILQNYGVKYNTKKMKRLLNDFEFCTMGNAIQDKSFEVIKLD